MFLDFLDNERVFSDEKENWFGMRCSLCSVLILHCGIDRLLEYSAIKADSCREYTLVYGRNEQAYPGSQARVDDRRQLLWQWLKEDGYI